MIPPARVAGGSRKGILTRGSWRNERQSMNAKRKGMRNEHRSIRS